MPYDPKRKAPPVATIGQLLRTGSSGRWFWAYCQGQDCSHRQPVALAPFAIRWGLDTSSDAIRRNLRCTRCGHRGVHLVAPSWSGDREVGNVPWPVGETG